MYRFLDRPVHTLAEHNRFLVAAMRAWTSATREGRCACRALANGFARRGVSGALPHFALAMAALDGEGLMLLRFGDVGACVTSEDEARLLALFACALEGDAPRAIRIAEQLVPPPAVQRLATAVGLVALHLANTVIEDFDK